MKKIVKIFFVLLFLIAQNLHAQNNKTVVKKNNITKDLNKIETAKINVLTIGVNQQKDTIIKFVKADSIAENDSIVRKVEPIDIAKEVVTVTDTLYPEKNAKVLDGNNIQPKLKITEDSVFYSKYNKSAVFADSIRNANKHWLDSTLSSLPKKKPVIIHEDDEIEIFVSGGGLYGGVNPKLFDRLTIHQSGLAHREFKTKLQGEQIEEKKLSREELRQLAQFIIDMGFFEFNKMYDCQAQDLNCRSRMKSDPEPVPLTVSVAIGARRNKIYVTFFAPKIEGNYVNYPINLEKIVAAIYAVATQ